ncbi:hypothetical protein OG936_29925 [Streptomyces sp. NBC_00846]|uniref:hypothetical protein n=1 Tax=Streptomyces sp. NBC_00846 TaxID=2975849 RepID=UPI00386F7A5B|nr:hypothetical protein OG936_29925 [Streptomyces sp. NBC_00846]
MHMITLRLVIPPGEQAAATEIAELFRAHFTPHDRIEHLWAHSAMGSVYLAFFLLADNEAEALLAARAACQRAIDRTPQLTRWQLPDS